MKRNSLFNCLVFSICVGLIASGLTGCGKGDSSKTENAETTVAEQSSKPADKNPSNSVANDTATKVANKQPADSIELKGVWYGESIYDVDAVNARLDELDPQQAQRLADMVNTFSTIVMAAEFRPDSVLEFDMMITTKEGQQLRDRSVGTWSIVAQTETGITIETKEYKNEDQQPTEKVYVYQFIDADRFQFVPESISPDLRPFSPRIVFQRVDETLDDAAVAEENDNKVIR